MYSMFFIFLLIVIGSALSQLENSRCLEKFNDNYHSTIKESWNNAYSICKNYNLVLCGNECLTNLPQQFYKFWINTFIPKTVGDSYSVGTFCPLNDQNDGNSYAKSKEVNSTDQSSKLNFFCRSRKLTEKSFTFKKLSFIQFDKWKREQWTLSNQFNLTKSLCATICVKHPLSECYGFLFNNNRCHLVSLKLEENDQSFVMDEEQFYDWEGYFRNNLCIGEGSTTLKNFPYYDLIKTDDILFILNSQIDKPFPIDLTYDDVEKARMDKQSITERKNIYLKPQPSSHYMNPELVLKMREKNATIALEIYRYSKLNKRIFFQHVAGNNIFDWFSKENLVKDLNYERWSYDVIKNSHMALKLEYDEIFVIKKNDFQCKKDIYLLIVNSPNGICNSTFLPFKHGKYPHNIQSTRGNSVLFDFNSMITRITTETNERNINMVENSGDLNPKQKEYYLVQIRDLEKKIERYQEKCTDLEIQHKEVEDKLFRLETQSGDGLKSLRSQLNTSQMECADLQDRLIGLQQVKDTEKDQYEKQLAQTRNDYQTLKDQLTNEKLDLQGKLADLEEFRMKKDQMIQKQQELEEMIEELKGEHSKQIYDLEKKEVIDKDRLKRKMLQRVHSVAADFRRVSNKRMADTTKRTIRENVSINSQLHKVSNSITSLMKENDGLKAKVNEVKQMYTIVKENEEALAKRNVSNQAIIGELVEKNQYLRRMIKEFDERFSDLDKIETENEYLRSKIDEQDVKEESWQRVRNFKEEEIVNLTQQHSQLISNHGLLLKILNEATLKITTSINHSTSAAFVLPQLLQILNTSKQFGIGPNLHELSQSDFDIPSAISEMKSPNISTDKSNNLKYKIGDAGTIMPPENQLPKKSEQLENQRKITMKSNRVTPFQSQQSTQTIPILNDNYHSDPFVDNSTMNTVRSFDELKERIRRKKLSPTIQRSAKLAKESRS
ncbi:hypothetical protein SNEBB_005016, partial [Seison nebaliae]